MKILCNQKEIFTNKLCMMIIAVFCVALWGNMIPAIQLGFDLLEIDDFDSISQMFFAGICFIISGIFTMIIPCIKSKKIILPKKNSIGDTIVLGVIQTSLQYILLYIGLSHTSGFNASIISSSGTFLIIILSHFIYKNDKMNFSKTIGCILGIIGAIILNFNSFYSLSPTFTIKGEGMIFLSTLTFVITTPLCKKLSKKESSLVFTGHSFIIGSIPLLMIGSIYGTNLKFNIYGILMLLYLALAAAISGALWNLLLEYNKVSEVTIYNFLVPVFGAASSAIMLNENICDFKNILSLSFTCIGIYYAQRESKKIKSYSVDISNAKENRV